MVTCENGRIKWGGKGLVLKKNGILIHEQLPTKSTFQLQLEAFAKSIRGENSNAPPPDDAVLTARVLDAMYEKAGLALRGYAPDVMKAVPWEVVPQDAEGHLWDVIVIGTGAGGSTAGFNLARLGRSVLFVERGKLLHHDPTVVRGVPFSWTGDPETALNHGWWPRPFYYREEEGGASVPTRPPIGSGAGGSTAQFNAVMDRFRPQDFTPRRFFPDISDASLPEAWPVSYEEMAPFYERAESLYRVRGTQDPLAPTGASLIEPPPASDRELAVFDALKGVGLNPYRIHSALEHVPGCVGCPGMLCPRACRNDAARICLYPALDHYGAKILPNCRAIRFEERGSAVERVICERDRRQIALRARVFIVAANAFLTPALLQRSASERFPNGLANSSGLVGHNLMLHASNHLFAGT